jgi:hypothetical protein
MMTIQNEFSINIAINIVAIAFMAGIYIQTIKTLKENQEKAENFNEKRITELKDYLLEKITDIKNHFVEHLNRVEYKQDKHNNLIERTYALEREQGIQKEKIKVANNRIEDLERMMQ